MKPAAVSRPIPARPIGVGAEPDQLFDLARGVTEAGGQLWIRGRGGSMYPFLRTGERVLLGPAGTRPPVGSVVLVRVHGQLFLHRVVAIADSGLFTRGDSSEAGEPWVSLDDVAGRAIAAGEEGELRSLTPTLQFGLLPLLRYLPVAAWSAARTFAKRALLRLAVRRPAP